MYALHLCVCVLFGCLLDHAHDELLLLLLRCECVAVSTRVMYALHLCVCVFSLGVCSTTHADVAAAQRHLIVPARPCTSILNRASLLPTHPHITVLCFCGCVCVCVCGWVGVCVHVFMCVFPG